MSIYLGFLFAVILYPIKYKLNNIQMPSIWVLLIPVFLIASDALFDLFGIFANSFLTRSITGAVAGFSLPFFLIPGFVKLVSDLSKNFLRKQI
jgi:uncharacterized membrane protein